MKMIEQKFTLTNELKELVVNSINKENFKITSFYRSCENPFELGEVKIVKQVIELLLPNGIKITIEGESFE